MDLYDAVRDQAEHKTLIFSTLRWTRDAGFSVDDKVKIIVKDNLLILEPVK